MIAILNDHELLEFVIGQSKPPTCIIGTNGAPLVNNGGLDLGTWKYQDQFILGWTLSSMIDLVLA